MPHSPTSLERWNAAWSGAGLRPPASTVHAALLARYAEPHRAYHTRQHLDECLGLLGELRDAAPRPDEIALALWFHDAIYDTTRQDNEALSAQWLLRVAKEAGATPGTCERLDTLVMATCHRAAPSDADGRLLVDIDLAILGAPAARYDEYERQVRQEYAWVPEGMFRARRCELLREFLARPAIYATAALAPRLEQAARANLQRAIAALS
jgi:predicted metal-dependent HD superfamily phosphohydrolase